MKEFVTSPRSRDARTPTKQRITDGDRKAAAKMMRTSWLCSSLVLALAVLSLGVGNAWAQSPTATNKLAAKRVENAAKAQAAARNRSLGLKPGVAGLAAPAVAPGQPLPGIEGPGGVPHYFGPYGNWAFSPLPKGNLNPALTVDAGGIGYSAPSVAISDAYDSTKGDTATATVIGGAITAIALQTGVGGSDGIGYSAPVVTITDTTGTGAAASATFNMSTVTGGLPKFVDKLPQLGPGGANGVIQAHGGGQYIPVGIAEPCTYSGQGADCYSIALVEYSERLSSNLPATRLRGYVQVYPKGTTTQPAGSVDLTAALGVSFPDGTKVYGYDNPHYLGPVLVAQGRVAGIANTLPADPGYPKPVRITFYNLLPSTSAGGDLYLPVDETVMGSGAGPALPASGPEKYTQNRATVHLHGNNTVWISDGNTHQWITPATENTAYPAGVSARNVPDMGTGCDAVAGTGQPGDPATRKSSGCQTMFYTNAQSARLMFYHDHAMGITRLNVYAGEAAGYVITDAVEKDLIGGTNISGVNITPVGTPCAPGAISGCAKVLPDLGIPLIIQDKTFVDASAVFAQDPTWNWGTGTRDANGNLGGLFPAITGDLWYPHVYMVVSNPYDPSGVNPFGKWFYGPWFNPPTPVCVNGLPVGCIDVGLVPNEYFGTAPLEPPMRPGVPNPSIPGESFLDTPLVNGTAYPYVDVPAGPVRFRVLNASNDRGLNLQLYKAADKTTWVAGTGAANPGSPTTVCNSLSANCTEVKMVPVSVNPANQFADTASGIPDPATAGPPWIQIGTEGGFMPAPVVVPQKPIGFNMNTGQFNFGIVNQHSLYLQPAERADVIVDFSGYADGTTLILYNDSPAPIPAGAAVYDFYTGNGDQTGTGGAPNTLPGYGPNTRTIMQIRVNAALPAGAPDYSLANLQAVWKRNGSKPGVFEVSQDPIIIPQAAYGSAYDNTSLPADSSQYVFPGDFSKTFNPLQYSAGAWSQNPTPVTLPLQMKAMHDEMGGVYDTAFGRMSGMLGLSNPLLPGMLPFPFSSPPTDLVKGSLEATPIGTLADGTQLWRIFHNGVDTHPIHVHMFTAQLINRVGQDGQVADGTLAVDPSDLGWKETFKVNPLEITYLALRPTVPTISQLPFEVPNSVRLIDPTLPEGATLPPPGPAGWFDPLGITIPEILNHYVNFGWEYVWHCHILSHEEMDFMHALVAAIPPWAPTGLSGAWNGNANSPRITLNWTDNALYEAGFTVQRALDANFTNGLVTLAKLPAAPGAGTNMTYTDTTTAKNSAYYYRVLANGAVVGDGFMRNFPTMSADSVSNTTPLIRTYATATVPSQPGTTVTATPQAGPQVSLTWTDTATNETGFYVQRCTVVLPATTCSNFALLATVGPRNNTGSVTYVDKTVAWGTSYRYQVAAFNGEGASPYVTATPDPVSLPGLPAAPTSFKVNATKNATGNNYTATLNWAATADPTNFTIQRASNLAFTTGLTSFTATGTARSLTQTVSRNTVYYYRIKANNSLGGSSAWTNALPFPIRTGP